jgi:hypothetical protein
LSDRVDRLAIYCWIIRIGEGEVVRKTANLHKTVAKSGALLEDGHRMGEAFV